MDGLVLKGEPVVNQDLIRGTSGLHNTVREGRVTYTWIPREMHRIADEKWNVFGRAGG